MYNLPGPATTGYHELIGAFDEKARQAAVANGWTPTYAAQVILRYLRDTDPETATVVATSLLLIDPPWFATSETFLDEEDTRIVLTRPVRVF